MARGDLGVELPPERLPSLQKDIISGYTALAVSKHRSKTPIMDELLKTVRLRLIEDYCFRGGDRVALILGLPLAKRGVTNLLYIYQL